MSINKHLAAALLAGAAVIVGAGAHAKGPQGAGPGAMPSQSASPASQGIGSNGWTNQPPGWSKADDSKGWDGGAQPPGFDSNTVGQEHGWGDAATTTPGLEKH